MSDRNNQDNTTAYGAETASYRRHAGQSNILRRNIHAIADLQGKSGQAKSRQERLADRITEYFGSISFVYLHVIWFGGWIIQYRHDQFPAIDRVRSISVRIADDDRLTRSTFLSTFVL